MILKKINNDWYILSNEAIGRGDFFYCNVDDGVYRSSIEQIGGGWANTTSKLIASSREKEGLPMINVAELEAKINELSEPIKQQETIKEYSEIEEICIDIALAKNKWQHLPTSVKRPNPIFFWQEVDSMIEGYILNQKQQKRLNPNETAFKVDVETINIHDEKYVFNYSDEEQGKPNVNENGFVNILSIKNL